MATFIRALLHHRAAAVVAILLSLVAALYAARSIRTRFQYRDFFSYPANDMLPVFKRDNEALGDPAGGVVVMVETDDVFRHEVLAYVGRLTKAIEPLPSFSRVRSLTSVNAIRGKEDEVVTGRLLPHLPTTPEETAEVKQVVMNSPLFVRRLVSADATATAVVAEMREASSLASIEQHQAAVKAVEGVLAKNPAPGGIQVRLTGAPRIEVETTKAIIRDLLVLNPVVCVILGLMLFAVFRSVYGVLLCLSSVGVATIWTAGIFACIGRPIDLIGTIIPVCMLVYGVVDPIFVLARFLGKTAEGVAREEAIVQALSELALPCFLTSLTTGIGFAAFVTSVAPAVRYFGLTVGIGVALAFVTTITVLPLLLSVVPLPRAGSPNTSAPPWLDRLMLRIGRVLERRAVAVVAAAFAILALGGWFGRDQQIRNGYVESLPRGQTQEDVRALERKLFGVARASIFLEGAPDSLKRPEVLRAIETIDRAVERHPGVTGADSLSDLVAEANAAFHGGAVEERRIPSSHMLVAQYLALIDPRDRSEFVTDSYAQSHISILMQDRGSEAMRQLRSELSRVIQSSGLAELGIKAHITGYGVVAYESLDNIVLELLYGFITAFLIVIAFEWLLFRSARIACLTIVPNLIPVAVCFLCTRIFGTPLRIDTTLILCISIGGLFNTTIHFVARVLQLVAAGERDPDDIVVNAMRSIGPPSLFTAIVLAVGFAVFLLSSFHGLQVLGMLSIVTLLTGFVCDVIFTPPFIRVGMNWEAAFRRTEEEVADRTAVPST